MSYDIVSLSRKREREILLCDNFGEVLFWLTLWHAVHMYCESGHLNAELSFLMYAYGENTNTIANTYLHGIVIHRSNGCI